MAVKLRTDSEDEIMSMNVYNNFLSDSDTTMNVENMERESRIVSASDSSDTTVSEIGVSSSFLRRAMEYQYQFFQGMSGELNSLYENAYMMLTPELQPISPATDIAESMRIFEDHKHLAQEYLQTQTEIECLLKVKEGLEKQLQWEENGGPLRDSPRFFQELRELQSENVGLVQLHQNLKEQLNALKGGKNQRSQGDMEPEPGWVMVPRR